LLAYGLSVLGSLLGLISTRRARVATTGGQRARWLGIAAFAIGGTGIWVMHFMAMIGFTVDDSTVSYDPAITGASFLTAVIVVGIGLFVVGYGRPRWWKVIIAGGFTGVGVAGMHYTGMAAMRVAGTIDYDQKLFDASVAIAVVAATVALWFTVNVRRPVLIVLAAAIMGVAVSGMHYTGMAALRVQESGIAPKPGGVTPLTFLVPIFVFVIIVLVILAYAMMANPQGVNTVTEDSFDARLAAAAPDYGATFGGAQAAGPDRPVAGSPADGGRPGGSLVPLERIDRGIDNGVSPALVRGHVAAERVPAPNGAAPTGTFADGEVPGRPTNVPAGPPGSGLGAAISLRRGADPDRDQSSGVHRR
jgi:NO-binding membrane sensor protein with MHYT domain